MFLTSANSLANLSREELVTLGAVISAMFTTIVFIALFFYILYIIINWKIFKKMGEPGWKSIIPILNDLTLWNKVWSIKAYLIFLGQMIILSLLSNYMKGINVSANSEIPINVLIVFFVGVILCITLIVTAVKYERRLARAFGKGDMFVLGLIFLSVIFDMILAFSSCEYLGNKSDIFCKKKK